MVKYSLYNPGAENGPILLPFLATGEASQTKLGCYGDRNFQTPIISIPILTLIVKKQFLKAPGIIEI